MSFENIPTSGGSFPGALPTSFRSTTSPLPNSRDLEQARSLDLEQARKRISRGLEQDLKRIPLDPNRISGEHASLILEKFETVEKQFLARMEGMEDLAQREELLSGELFEKVVTTYFPTLQEQTELLFCLEERQLQRDISVGELSLQELFESMSIEELHLSNRPLWEKTLLYRKIQLRGRHGDNCIAYLERELTEAKETEKRAEESFLEYHQPAFFAFAQREEKKKLLLLFWRRCIISRKKWEFLLNNLLPSEIGKKALTSPFIPSSRDFKRIVRDPLGGDLAEESKEASSSDDATDFPPLRRGEFVVEEKSTMTPERANSSSSEAAATFPPLHRGEFIFEEKPVSFQRTWGAFFLRLGNAFYRSIAQLFIGIYGWFSYRFRGGEISVSVRALDIEEGIEEVGNFLSSLQKQAFQRVEKPGKTNRRISSQALEEQDFAFFELPEVEQFIEEREKKEIVGIEERKKKEIVGRLVGHQLLQKVRRAAAGKEVEIESIQPDGQKNLQRITLSPAAQTLTQRLLAREAPGERSWLEQSLLQRKNICKTQLKQALEGEA